ncbi:GFA family protein [Inquilinus sp. NPDC058860]|uniref:GFA family protein n=1 Tax=Inquilinus sp. NPDC058860 TaxID=3346652 RepID=UPI0036B2A6E7
MTKLTLPQEGRCRCGRVRFRITARPLLTMACHCTGCRRMTGSAFSLSAAIPSEGFAVTEGEPVIGGLHGPSRHYFCPHCLSWLFTRPEGLDQFVNIRSTMLDDPAWSVPFIETFTSEKLPWAATPAMHSYETFPPTEAYGPLVEAFAARSAS